MANHNLGTIRGTIEIDYDGAGIVKAVRDTDKAKKSFGSLDGASSKVLNVFSGMVKGFLKVGGAINVVTNGVSILTSALAAIGPVVAAGFAVAPAVILSFASALVVAKIAVSGVGDALSAAFGPADKFNEALEKLSPNAQAMAKAFRASTPALTESKKAIQDAFFSGAAEAVAGIVKRLVSLTAQARGVAFAMGQIAQNVLKTATNSVNIERLRTILSGVNAFLLQIRRSLGPVVTGFIGLAAQASKFGGVLGGQAANAIAKFSIWLNGLDLDAIFAKALPIIQQLGGFLKDIGTIAQSLFSIFIGDGGTAVGVIGQLVSQFAAFLKTAEGVALIDSLRQALQAISTGAGQVFLALLQALTPAIIALLPGITQLANQLVSVLVPAINALAPLLLNISKFLSDNMSWLGPVAGAVVALAAAYKVYAAAAKVVAAVQGVLSSKIVVSTAKWIANTAAIVANKVAQAASAAVTGGAAVAAWVASTAAIVANRVAVVAGTVAMAAVRAATIAWTAVQWALNVALNANPIGLIVLAVAALVAGIILLWKNSETFRTIVLAVWGAIKTAIKATVDWLINTAWPIIKKVVDFIINYYKTLWEVTKAIWTGIYNAIKTALTWIKDIATTIWNAIVAGIKAYINAYKTVIMAGVNFVKAVWNNFLTGLKIVAQTIWGWITSFIRTQVNAIKTVINGIKVVVTYVKNAFTNARNAAVSMINNLLSAVRAIPGRITSALGNLGSLLYNKGKQIIQGFINGIGAMIGAVRNKARSIVSAVTDFLPGSPAKEGPLSGKGYVLLRARRFMSDFAQGIDDGSQKPTAALAGAINPLARATVPAGSTTKSGASSTPTTQPATGGTRTYQVAIGQRAFAELVVDAVTGAPIAVSNAAKEGDRQTKFAGSGRR